MNRTAIVRQGRQYWPLLIVLLPMVALLLLRWLYPERTMDYVGPRALLDAVFTIGLTMFIVLLAEGIGLEVIRLFYVGVLPGIEIAVFAWSIGAAIIAYGILGLGLLGYFRPMTILIWLLSVGVIAKSEIVEITSRMWDWINSHRVHGIKLDALSRFAIGWAVLLGAVTIIQVLTPPWDYDGLMYHLDGLREFFDHERIVLLPDMLQANSPFTLEMLFSVGIALESDTVSKAVNFVYLVILFLAVYSFGKRFFGEKTGWNALIVMLGIPILPFWGASTNTDVGQVTYEFLGLYAIMLWVQQLNNRWLIFAGLMVGVAVGTKYTALAGALALVVWILWFNFQRGFTKKSLLYLVIFSGTVAVVGLPWYTKNLILGKNPLFPLFFGGKYWDSERVALLTDYLRSFGTGRNILDYILLPWNLYAKYTKFSTLGGWDFPSLLFPLIFVLLKIPKNRIMKGVGEVTLLRFLFWSIGSHQTRFLLPIYPALSLMVGSVLASDFSEKWRILKRWFPRILIGMTVVMVFAFQLQLILKVRPLGSIVGTESKNDFLIRNVDNMKAIQHIQTYLDERNKLFLLWDGKRYYCIEHCLPAGDQSKWTWMVQKEPEPEIIAKKLREENVSYILINIKDVVFFLEHDPRGLHQQALNYFFHVFQPQCTQLIYQDQWAYAYRLTCP